jgi:hypothetical protein
LIPLMDIRTTQSLRPGAPSAEYFVPSRAQQHKSSDQQI